MPAETGAPENEVEVTPEMIEAGCHEYLSYDERFERLSAAVVRIWRAMERARTSAPLNSGVDR